jgi:predicted Zn-dependent peptidase
MTVRSPERNPRVVVRWNALGIVDAVTARVGLELLASRVRSKLRETGLNPVATAYFEALHASTEVVLEVQLPADQRGADLRQAVRNALASLTRSSIEDASVQAARSQVQMEALRSWRLPHQRATWLVETLLSKQKVAGWSQRLANVNSDDVAEFIEQLGDSPWVEMYRTHEEGQEEDQIRGGYPCGA